VKAIERETVKPSHDRLPLSMGMIREMVSKIGSSPEDIRNMFMIILMTSAMLRESEVVQLQLHDVQVIDDKNQKKCLSVFIRRSKTDQTADGASVCLAETGTSLCPIMWYHKYIMIRDHRAVFFFHQLGARMNLVRPLATRTPNFVVKKMLKTIGVDPLRYGSHSCRKGGCSIAVEAGVDIRLVAQHGRWKSGAILDYVKDSLDTKLSVSKKMLESEKSLSESKPTKP
jgi:site-specific recombinase XerD